MKIDLPVGHPHKLVSVRLIFMGYGDVLEISCSGAAYENKRNNLSKNEKSI
jgi:hypothetical protein